MKKKTVIIAGAGPAGLTAAYELLKHSTEYHPIVLEATDYIGGISRTAQYRGNRIDIGGHRFFSKSKRVTDFWEEIMPLQGHPSTDDALLGKTKAFAPDGPDPEKEDRTMLIRERVSRIFYLRKFFSYPVTLSMETLRNMGFANTVKVGLGYIGATLKKRPEDSLENFYINRFGKPLYSMFFEDYTEKVWGKHPSKLGADWGSQRVKGLSVMAILKDIITKKLFTKRTNVETSLIEEFVYPKYGPGQLWETVAEDVKAMGGEILTEHTVTKVNVDENQRVTSVEAVTKDGKKVKYDCDYFISSMPIKDLVPALQGINIDDHVREIAATLPYRDFITVGLLVDKLKIKNTTKRKTYLDRVPDTWIYIQERDVRIGRLQVFNNWSPYMVADFKNTMWIGMEYFCTEGDEMWTMPEEQFKAKAIAELAKIDIIEPDAVIDSVEIKMRKAYPAYYGSYYELDKVRDVLDTIPNLYCIGRNGQHRYNNMDHSMLTAMETVDNILSGNTDKTNVWAVNTEEEYHETKNNNAR